MPNFFLLFPKTRLTLIFTPLPDPKNLTDFGTTSSSCFLVMHHVRIIFPLK